MSEITTIITILGLKYYISTALKSIVDWLKGLRSMPVSLYEGDTRPPAVIVNFSVDATKDTILDGYSIIAELGTPKQLTPKELTRWAEGAAVIISKLRGTTGPLPLTIVLACPVTVAFIIGNLLGHTNEYRIVHRYKDRYVPLDPPDLDRFRRSL